MTTLALKTAVTLILMLIIIGFLITLWFYINAPLQAETAKRMCQLSIEKRLNVDSYSPVNPYHLECPRRIILLNNNAAEIFVASLSEMLGKASTYTYQVRDDPGVTEREITQRNYDQGVKEAIAYEMTECWDLFSRGERDVLRALQMIPGNTCFICSEVHLRESRDLTIQTQDILDLQHHLRDEHSRRFPTVDDLLYGAPTQANQHLCKEQLPEQIELTDQDPLAIVYSRKAGIFTERCQAMNLVPIKELTQNCKAII